MLMGECQLESVNIAPDQLLAAIEEVAGVVMAKPEFNESGHLIQLHVIAGTERNPKQIVRDIESVCRTRFDLEIDHRVVSVAQIEGEDEGDFFISRLYPQKIEFSTSGSVLEARVHLASTDGSEYSGSAKGPAAAANKIRLVALATLEAIKEYLQGFVELILDDVHKFNIGSYESVLVGLTLVTAKGDENLVGSAIVHADLSEAVIKAVLDAVNRRVALLVAS